MAMLPRSSGDEDKGPSVVINHTCGECCGGGGGGGTSDHEALNNLMGGDEDGHYHLTEDQLDTLIEMINEKYAPKITGGQEFTVVVGEEMPPFQVEGLGFDLTD